MPPSDIICFILFPPPSIFTTAVKYGTPLPDPGEQEVYHICYDQIKVCVRVRVCVCACARARV